MSWLLLRLVISMHGLNMKFIQFVSNRGYQRSFTDVNVNITVFAVTFSSASCLFLCVKCRVPSKREIARTEDTGFTNIHVFVM